MDDVNKEPKNDDGVVTPPQDGSPEKKDGQQEENPTPKNDGADDGEVKLSQKEFNDLQKKANDFDGLVNKNKVKALFNKDKPEPKEDGGSPEFDEGKIAEIAKREAQSLFREERKESYKVNTEKAFDDFLKENSWADSDEKIKGISNSFNPGSSTSKDDIKRSIELAARDAYPSEYEANYASKVKGQVLAEMENKRAGGIGGGSVNQLNKDTKTQAEKEGDEVSKRMTRDLPPGFDYEKKKK